ncbi:MULTISPECIES: hypothetical protein [Streptomyces]|uniref:hypothetical protein n=1 Tax=Streptomyces TaxID=1883 RepID=UPI001D0B3CA8|nr:hypothetical protein [Streptomyces longhuiensis]UDM00165.1 hypothetical protein LGI35_18695 [Streptomyces longhuiensis]
MTISPSSFQPGDIRTRADIRKELGGSPQGGITPSKEKKTVVLYSDIGSGEQYGYRDGWLREEDHFGPVYEYTGAGTLGDQVFSGGNASILRHAIDGRTLHLFIAHGKVRGSDTKTHRYIGAFKLDASEPYIVRQARDEDKKNRDVIVFRLRPIGTFFRLEADEIPPAKKTTVSFIRSRMRRRLEEPKDVRDTRQRDMSAAIIASRNREDLVADYEETLSQRQHHFGRLEIQVRDIEETLQASLYDESAHTLYEPAGSASRQALKDALVQLIDISRHLNSIENGMPLRCMVLAPELPGEDIRQLLTLHNVGIVYRDENGDLTELQGTGQNPLPGGTSRGISCLDCPARLN